ncbi:MAG: AMP-binding protein, partial [Halieaceae bacterium]|nr:AMP-binding protein [Halieaceae bacterium]
MLYHAPVDYQADRRPHNTAVFAHDYQWHYADLVAASHSVANELLSMGVKPGDRIGVLGLNSAAHLAVFLAGSRIGAVTVSVNFRLAPPEIAFILDDAGVEVLFVTDNQIDEIITATIGARTGKTRLIANREDAEQQLKAVIDGNKTPVVSDRYMDERAPVLQLYTSGTTGKPKGVVLSHRNIGSLVGMMGLSNNGQYTSDNVDCCVAPMFHIGGAGIAYLTLATGGHCILQEAFDPVRVVETIQRDRVNTMFMVPAMMQAIVKLVPNVEQYDLSSMESIAYGAAPISETLLREAMALFKCDFTQVYGMTETTGTVLALPPEDHERALNGEAHLLRSCGKTCPGNEVKIIDSDGNRVAAGVTGEICLRSASNMVEYFGRPDATEKTLVDGWVMTGDAGFIDEDGYVFLRDRLKDMVVTGGENVYPVEVENVLAGLPGVVEVAVIGVPDEKYGEALLAIFAMKPGAEIT